MSGEQDLGRLLATLDPHLHPEVLVYAEVGAEAPRPDVEVFASIVEAEGTTVVVAEETARALGLRHEFPCRRIELRVHSSLDAVGMTAAFATALADHGISANVIAGLRHDHLLVPVADAERAVAVLRELQRHSAAQSS